MDTVDNPLLGPLKALMLQKNWLTDQLAKTEAFKE